MLPNERLRLAIVWVAILGLSAFTMVLQSMRPELEQAAAAEEGVVVSQPERTGDAGASATREADAKPSDEELLAELGAISLQTELVGRICVAFDSVGKSYGGAMDAKAVLSSAQPLDREGAPFLDRVAYAALVGKVEGWDRGLEELKSVTTDGAAQRRLRDLVEGAMELRADPVFAAATGAEGDASRREWDELLSMPTPWGSLAQIHEALQAPLGFYAQVLDPREDEAVTAAGLRTLGVLLGVGAWYGTVFLGGLCVLVALFVLSISGRLAPALVPSTDAHRAIVLGETFAIWMALFLLLQVAAAGAGEFVRQAIPAGAPAEFLVGPAGLAFGIVAFLASLVVLVYPRMRGISRAELRELTGMHAGRGVLKEAIAGVGCYLSAVPLLAVGLVVFAVLSALRDFLFGVGDAPSHPAAEMLGGASALEAVLLFTLASIVAPIVEEIVFRGVLYGHLRGVALPRVRVGSMLVSALASSAIFAAIHPQGALFVPALGGLAVGFCIFREVRGSLVAPMVAHGINNAVTLTIGLSLFGA